MVTQWCTNGTLISWCVFQTSKAGWQLLAKAGMPGIAKVLVLYMWYNEVKARFFALSKQMQGLSSLVQLTALQSLGSSLTNHEDVDEHVQCLPDSMDEEIRFVTYFML